MPRRRRGWIDNACYHITHRCHEREFLFKFSKYRDIYINQLFETKQRFNVDILNYIVTSNHVHLLVTAKNGKNRFLASPCEMNHTPSKQTKHPRRLCITPRCPTKKFSASERGLTLRPSLDFP